MDQRRTQRGIRNPEQAAEWLFELQDQQHGSRHGKRAGAEHGDDGPVPRREQPEAREDDAEPRCQHDQEWQRDGIAELLEQEHTCAREVERAVTEGARVINLSFAGPQDPMLQQSLKSAREKGVVLIAAAGNAGPKSAPLYPAADPSVIAVTATDSEDQVYKGANRGKYIAVAAPGVDILVPAPERNYELSTGTSVAAAHVSGVAALLLARNPSLNPDNVRQILTDSARSMGPKGLDEYGAGLTDAYKAVLSLDPSGAALAPAATAVPTR